MLEMILVFMVLLILTTTITLMWVSALDKWREEGFPTDDEDED